MEQLQPRPCLLMTIWTLGPAD
uniref:Uncharacterized protein n=1 Tax=Macrostomum lignano TaxID=282301 RepID=A0A1I8FEM1_9PLAT